MRGGHEIKENLLELIHYYVFGPLNVKSLGGSHEEPHILLHS